MLQDVPQSLKLRLAIYRSSSIGDVVLATACIQALKRLRFTIELFWLGSEPSLDLIRRSFPEVRCIDVKSDKSSSGRQRVVEALAGVHLLVDLQTNLRSKWFGMQLQKHFGTQVFSAPKLQIFRSKLVLGARLRGRRAPIPSSMIDPQLPQFALMVDTLKRALSENLPIEYLDGLEAHSARPQLAVTNPQVEPWQQELHHGRWLAVAPGAAHATKRAPTKLLTEILSQLARDFKMEGVGLLLLGNGEDRARAAEILQTVPWLGPTLNLAGRLSLWQTTIALNEAEILLGNDSALTHIAEAVGTPASVLFGPTVEAFGFGPHLRNSKAFSVPLGCRPCSKHGKSDCRYRDHKCFADLDTEAIARHLGKYLASTVNVARDTSRPPSLSSIANPKSTSNLEAEI